MVIVDFQQVMIATMMRQIGNSTDAQLDENMLRHMVLNVLRSYRTKFKGELVIACDTGRSWRKEAFPYYKAHRNALREKSTLDWPAIFEAFTKLKAELTEFFPYRVIAVDRAEADDVIGVLVNKFGMEPGELMYGDKKDITIISGDHDFRQLQKYSNVKQYDPVQKKWIDVRDAASYLKEHIIRGDPGDGVPNFLSTDDSFVMKKRQKQIREVKLDVWMTQTPEEICDTEEKVRNWKRNEQLVDLAFTPTDIAEQIIEQFNAQANKPRNKIENYFIKKRLKHLHEYINDF